MNNYPNPFNPTTNISFSVLEEETATIEIFNAIGQSVKKYSKFQSGNHEISWDGTDNNGQKVSSGIFFYKLQSPSVNQTNKMILLK